MADDDWTSVDHLPKDDWQPVEQQTQIPQAFVDRVERGSVISRILKSAVSTAKEGFGDPTPTGLSDETLNAAIDLGIFHDPAHGKPNPVQFANETLLLPTAKAFDTLVRGVNAGLYGAAGAMGELVDSLGGEGPRAKREVINFGNWAMIEGGMGRFSRPKLSPAGPHDQVIGGLPKDADFKAAAEIASQPKSPLREKITANWEPGDEAGFSSETNIEKRRLSYISRHVTAANTGHVLTWWENNPLYSDIGKKEGLQYVQSLSTIYALDGENVIGVLKTSREKGEAILDHLAVSPEWRGKRISSNLLELAEENIPNIRMDKTTGLVSEEGARAVNAYNRRVAGLIGESEISASVVESRLRELWEERGIHPAEALHDAQNDAFLKHDLTAPAEEPPQPLRAVGAEVTSEPPIVPLTQQPTPPAGSLVTAAQGSLDKLYDIGRDIQMLTTPMARGTQEAQATAKDFANSMRRNRWEWSRIDDDIAKRFTPEQRKRMWDAADEESVIRQEFKEKPEQLAAALEHMGLATLEPTERDAVVAMQTRAQTAWLRAVDRGMVQGDGLPSYTPRMIINTIEARFGDKKGVPLNGLGTNLRTTTSALKRRKHLTAEETEAAAKASLGEEAAIARDIRTLPLRTAQLEDAIAGRTMIDNIKEAGKRTGEDTVAEGFKPAKDWFTIDHPSFRTWRPKFKLDEETGKTVPVKDADGNILFEQAPIYVRGDFEGPLRAVLTQRNGPLYNAAMDIKGKTMSLIMNSPLIHNAVEWGRAIPAMPGKVVTFRVYFEGNRAKNNLPFMREAIDNGLVPIGHRFFNQDISSIMEEPSLAPGRSWTAKVLGAVPGLLDEGAGNAVKAAIDKAGNFWHNTLLWDRVADLQMGLYTNFRSDLIAKGVDAQTASRAAAHWANRYAGALPVEAMSDNARKIANMFFFSRTFTLGNIGAMKDMFTGLPKDVMAQVSRDVGNLDPKAAGYIKKLAVRKAVAIVAMDMGLMYVGNSLLQSGVNVLAGDRTLDEEMRQYAVRMSAALGEVHDHPAKLLQPFHFLESVSATAENEPGKQDRIRIGNAKDGTAIYARNPVGKIGEEFMGWATSPLDMIRRKEGTIARPLWQIMANDKGFGRKVYDPNADTVTKYLDNLGLIVGHLAQSQIPMNQVGAVKDLVKGEGDSKVAALQAFGPMTGVTFSKGAPGGPAVGELYHSREMHDYAVQAALPDIRKQIQRGDIGGAAQRMTELGIPPGLQRFYIRTSANPATRLNGRTIRDFYLYATPEQRQRLENSRSLSNPYGQAE